MSDDMTKPDQRDAEEARDREVIDILQQFVASWGERYEDDDPFTAKWMLIELEFNRRARTRWPATIARAEASEAEVVRLRAEVTALRDAARMRDPVKEPPAAGVDVLVAWADGPPSVCRLADGVWLRADFSSYTPYGEGDDVGWWPLPTVDPVPAGG